MVIDDLEVVKAIIFILMMGIGMTLTYVLGLLTGIRETGTPTDLNETIQVKAWKRGK